MRKKYQSPQPITTDLFCEYGCGQQATHITRQGVYICQSHSTKCPINRKKNRYGLKDAYKNGKRKPASELYTSLDQDTKDKMAWSRGKTVYSDFRVSGVSKRPIEEYFCANSKVIRSVIRNLILKNNLLEYKCSECGITDWNGKSLGLQLDHINGINNDHRLENLRFLCPNCHSQTPTFCGKNIKTNGKQKVTDSDFLAALQKSDTIHEALRKLNLSIGKAHYERATKLLIEHQNAGMVK